MWGSRGRAWCPEELLDWAFRWSHCWSYDARLQSLWSRQGRTPWGLPFTFFFKYIFLLISLLNLIGLVLTLQVLSLLPPYEGKSVLELGAGIGRFTGELAQKAGQLIALDFIDSVIKKVFFSYLLSHSQGVVFTRNCSSLVNVYCRMRVSTGTTRMWSLCVLMSHPLTSTSLMDPLIWFSPTGFSCISLTKRYIKISSFYIIKRAIQFFF